MFENGLPVKRILIGFVVIIAIIWGLILLHRSSTGSLTVTTNSKTATVSVRPLQAYQGGSQTKSATQTLKVRLKPGQYVISASDHAYITSKVVEVKAKQSRSYTLKLTVASVLEPVYSADATAVAADSSSLVYVDDATKSLMYLGPTGRPRLLGNVFVKQANLVSPKLGVVQGEDGKLYSVSGTSVTQLNTGGRTVSKDFYSISLSGTGLLAFISGHEIYAGQIGSTYKPIFHVDDDETKVFSGKGKVFVVAEPEGGGEAEGENEVSVVDVASGKKITKEFGALQASWSPSDKYLFVAAEDGNTLYDSSLNRVSTLDSIAFPSFAWVNDNVMAYATSSQAWLYNVSTKQASQIADSESQLTFVYVTPDHKYVYLASDAGSGSSSGGIARVGLAGQKVPSYLQTLDIFLPDTIGVCTLDYINFVRPTITIKYPSSGTDPKQCVKAAKGELNYNKVDPSKFDFVAIPYDPHY